MSQVRKFQNGSKTAASTKQESSTAKTYKLIINGREINLDQDGLADFRKAGSGQGGMMGNVYADIADALESGHTVKYNSDSNTIYGVDFKRIDPKILEKVNENQSWTRKAQRRANRYARNDSLPHQFNSALASIGSINFEKRKEDDTISSDTLTSLYSTDPRQFDYNKGEDGTLIWSDGPQNAGNLTALNNFIDMLGMSEEDAKKKYSWTGYDDQIRDLRSWYTGNQNYDWEALRSRIRANKLDDADWDILRYMGFGENQSSLSTDSSTDSSTNNTPRSYEGSGFNNDALEQAGYYVKKDENGNVYLYDNNGNVVQDKIYLRDTPWAKGTQWAGGAVYQGRFITADELLNQNSEANRDFQSWVNAGYTTDELGNLLSPDQIRELRDQTGWKYEGYGRQSPFSVVYDRSRQTLNGFNNIFTDPNQYYIADLTPQYNVNDGTQIISFLNQSNKRDKDGILNPYYAVSGVDQIFKTQEELQNYLNSRHITTRSGVLGQSNLNIRDYFDQDGKRYTQSNKTVKIGDKNFDIFRDQDGLYYVRGLDKKGKPNFIQLFGRNIMNKIINNQPITHDELLKGRAEEDKKSIAGKIWNWTWLGLGNDISRNTDWYNLKEYDKALGFKKGGKIPILQYGGIFSRVNNNVKTTKASENRVGEASKAFGEQKELKTSVDKWAKAAGFLDTAGAAATFIPGYGNISGAVTGAIGSLLRLGADIQRDGAQLSDFTKFAGNIGLDLLTLIPGVGSAAKAAKIAKGANAVKDASKISKGIKQVAEPVLNFIGNNSRKITGITSGAGIIGGGIMAGSAMFGDDKFTSDDFATAAQGALGITGGIKNLRNLKKSAEAIQTIAGKKTFNEIKNQEGDKWGKRVSNAWKNWRGNSKANSANNKSVRSLMFNDRLTNQTLQESLKNSPNLRKLAMDKDGHFDEKLFNRLQNEMGQFLSRTGQTYTLNGKTIIGKQINPSWYNGQQFTTIEKSDILALPPHISTNPANSINSPLLLPAWKGSNFPEVNVLSSSNSSITTPSSPLIQIPEFASSYRNAQGQLLLPRGNGRFFKKTQRVWNGGPAHEVVSIQPAKYSATPKKPRFRNIGLEQAHKNRVLQEAGKQQVPAIRGLQEDIAKVRTSEDFKNLLIKINNRGSYKEIIKNNPEIKDQLRQMFVHLAPVRLGNWMTNYNLRFKKGGRIVKAQHGTKMPFGTFVQDNNLNDPNLYDYSKSGIQFNGSNVDWTKTYGNGTFMDYRQIYLDDWDTPEFKSIRDAYLAQLSKGNANVDLNNFTKDDFARLTQDKKLGYAHNLYIEPFAEYLNTIEPAVVTAYKSKIGPLQRLSTPSLAIATLKLGTPAQIMSREELDAKRAENINADGSQVAGGQEIGSPVGVTKSGRGFNWNPDDLIGLANLGYSVHKNNQMYGVLDDAIRKSGRALQKEMPTEIYDRYQDHITPIYQEAADNKRQFFVPTSTDTLTNYAMRQTNEDAAQQLLTEGRLKASEAYSQYLDKDLAARRTYADARRETANQNRAIMASTIMQLGQNDAARRLANNQSVQNFVMEFRNKLAQDRQKKKQFQLQDAQVQAQNAYNAKYNELGNKWMQAFNALSDTEKKTYGTWEGYWQDRDINDYNNAIEQASIASRNIMQDFYPTQLDYFGYKPSKLALPISTTRTVYYGKKGGKTPTYLKRHTGQKPDEAIWIQRNKDTAKALEKLHDAVIKLFMKALS